MRKEKSFPVISIIVLVVFGLLCFLGGFLSSNISNKRRVNAIQARLSECENKFLSFSRHIIGNTEAVVKIAEGVSSVWHECVKRGVDFNSCMEKFLADNKAAIADLKLRNDLIEIQISEVKKYKKESEHEFDAVMELYDVYKKMYELGMNPTGTLEGFDSNRETLVAAYMQVQSKLIAYMPGLKDQLSGPEPVEASAGARQHDAQPQDARKAKIPVVDKMQFFEPVSAERLTFDQQVKKISRDMTYRQAESEAGVPRDKTKDSQGHEVWIYPSEKTGFRNVVYFAAGKVVQTKNLPLSGKLD